MTPTGRIRGTTIRFILDSWPPRSPSEVKRGMRPAMRRSASGYLIWYLAKGLSPTAGERIGESPIRARFVPDSFQTLREMPIRRGLPDRSRRILERRGAAGRARRRTRVAAGKAARPDAGSGRRGREPSANGSGKLSSAMRDSPVADSDAVRSVRVRVVHRVAYPARHGVAFRDDAEKISHAAVQLPRGPRRPAVPG